MKEEKNVIKVAIEFTRLIGFRGSLIKIRNKLEELQKMGKSKNGLTQIVKAIKELSTDMDRVIHKIERTPIL